MDKRIDYTQVLWEITKELQEAESLENALRFAQRPLFFRKKVYILDKILYNYNLDK